MPAQSGGGYCRRRGGCTMKQQRIGKSVATMGLLLALALLCSYVETLIPMNFGSPGIKLGLANVVVLISLYLLGAKEAFVISFTRILLSGFLFGNLFAILYGLGGGILSFFVMLLLKKAMKCSILTVSVAGGIFHNLGQLLVAALVVENLNLLYYMSILFFAGFVTGALIGIVSREIIKRIQGLKERD